MNFETLVFKEEGPIGILTINRPQALNALNAKLLDELDQFLNEVVSNRGLRALIVTGAGEKAFVAGADIKEMESISGDAAQGFAERGQRIFQKIEDLKVPTIAVVNGFALGGGLELAMACDFILASQNAKLGLPEVSLGLIPGYGGTQRLARYCGKGIARLMTLTGDLYTAEQCAQWGLVSMVAPSEELMNLAMKVAQKIVSRSPIAIQLAKKAINKGFDVNQAEGMQLEAQNFQMAFQSADKKEGVAAFIAKRPPQFVGE